MGSIINWWDTILIAIAALAAVAGNLARIQGTYGSVSNWVKRRKQIRAAMEKEADHIKKTLVSLETDVKTLTSDMKEVKEYQQEGQAMDMLILRDQILEMTDRAIRRGYEYPEEIDKINTLVDLYQKRGGNGAVTSRVARVRNLPIRHRREPWEVDHTKKGTHDEY